MHTKNKVIIKHNDNLTRHQVSQQFQLNQILMNSLLKENIKYSTDTILPFSVTL